MVGMFYLILGMMSSIFCGNGVDNNTSGIYGYLLSYDPSERNLNTIESSFAPNMMIEREPASEEHLYENLKEYKSFDINENPKKTVCCQIL